MLALLLPAISRWVLSALPGGPDQAIHVFRAVELDWAITQGVWYPRWAADLVYGFGYPLFNVYGPATQYLIVGLHRLGLSFVAAALTAFALADLVAGAGAYVLGRALFGVRAGWLTALAYTYSPYVLMSLQRGALPEAWGLALLPWLLWSVWELHHSPGAGPTARTAAFLAALPFIHNPSTAMAGGCVVGLLGVLTLMAPAGRRLRPALAVIGALTLGLAASAWYWLPLVFEVQAIHIERAYSPPVLDYHYHFLTLAEVFAWPQPFDRHLIGADVPRALGWVQTVLAAAALVGLGRWPRERRAVIGAAVLGAGVLIGLTQSGSVSIWEHLPGLSLIQFPARLLGPASLLLAIGVGSVVPATAGTATARALWMAPIAAAGLVLYALPWTFIGTDPSVSPNPTLTEIQDWERRTGTIGTTTAGEYLPIWVEELPDPDTLRGAYAAGAPVARLATERLPDRVRIESQTAGYTRQQVVLESPVGFTAVFHVFYFPGWHATVNGIEVPLAPTTPHGLISFEIPAGRATIELDFGTTLPRQIGGALSVIGLALLAVLAWRGRRGGAAAHAAKPLSWGATAALTAVGLALLAVRVVSQGNDTPFVGTRLNNGAVAGVQQPRVLDFGRALQLLGLEQDSAEIPADGAVALDLYWRALEPERPDYSVQVSLRDTAGNLFGQSDSQHPAEFPTSRWQLSDYARDRHTLTPYPGTPPGRYRLTAAIYRQADGFQLSAPQDIGAVIVTCPPTAPTLAPTTPLAATFGPVRLFGVDWVTDAAGVGEDVRFNAYWSVTEAPDLAADLRVSLISTDGTSALEAVMPPVRADAPTTTWRPGCDLRAPLAFRLPADLPGGRYEVRIALVNEAAALGPAVAIGELQVEAPERRFDPPDFAQAAGVRFDEVAELTGWTLSEGRLTLVWRALATPQTAYTVFVHALGADDVILSQIDAEPLSGARPTTSWVSGEYLSDVYSLDQVGAARRYRIGLYDPATGQRLSVSTDGDFLILEP